MAPLPPLDSLSHAEKDALILALLARVEELCARVAELEAKLGLPPKTPDNSSTPPSKGQKASAPATGKSEGKRKPHAGAHRPLHPKPTTRRDIAASSCRHCGADVSRSPQFVCEDYDHVEIPPITPQVTRVSLLGGTCPCCDKKFKAEPPADMPKGSPFGENLRALVIYLRFTQGIAFERLSTLLHDMLGLEISEGALVNMLEASRDAFAKQVGAIRAGQTAVGDRPCNRTKPGCASARAIGGCGCSTTKTAPSSSPSRRGPRASSPSSSGTFQPDYWVSDRYGGQMGWAGKEHQVCLAHLIRDVQYAIDCGDDLFAPGLRHLLGRACRLGRRRERLSDATLKSYERRLDARLDQLMALEPSHQAGVKLKSMIRRTRASLFVFMTRRELPPTNNGSERALRPCAVFRKITNGFRTERAAKLYADIRSTIETAPAAAPSAPWKRSRLTLAGKSLEFAGA